MTERADPLEIGPLGADELEEVVDFFSVAFPKRPREKTLARWLYLDCPASETIVSRSGGRIQALSSALRREYTCQGQTLVVREPFDVFARPGLLSGAHLFCVTRAQLNAGESCLAAGGSEAFVKHSRTLGYREIGVAHSYLLPVRAAAASDLARQWMPSVPSPLRAALSHVTANLYWRTSLPPLRRTGRLVATNSTEGLRDLYKGSRVLAQLPSQTIYDWLRSCRHPANSQFLLFRCEDALGALVGWTLLRVFKIGSEIEGEIVEIFSPHPPAYRWIIRAIVRLLRGYSVSLIRARASSLALRAALRSTRFLEGPPIPVLYLGEEQPEGELHVCRGIADVPLRPYA